jgi:hypothetical protein
MVAVDLDALIDPPGEPHQRELAAVLDLHARLPVNTSICPSQLAVPSTTHGC